MDTNFPNNPFSMLVQHLEGQKQQQRAQDDAEIDRRIALIHDMISGPGANPARTAEGISNLMELYGAKGGRGTPKKGAGPWGGQEIPMPSLLAGVIHGSIPMEGPTTEAVPKPQSPSQQGLMPEASAILPGLSPLHNADGFSGGIVSQTDGQRIGDSIERDKAAGTYQSPADRAAAQGYTGQSVLNSPTMIPPQPLQAPPEATRMLGAARDMQQYNQGPKTRPVANQPIRKSHEEMVQEQANDAALMGSTKMTSDMQTEYNNLVKMGTNPDQAKLAVAEKYGLKPQTAAQKPTKGPIMQYTDPRDGTTKTTQSWLQLQPDGSTKALDSYGLPLPLDAQPFQKPTAGANSNKFFTDDTGEITAVSPDFVTHDIGKFGKSYHAPTGSAGPVVSVADPNRPGVTSMGRVGKDNVFTPITIPGQNGTSVNAAKPFAPEKMSAQGKQALVGLNLLQNFAGPMMEDLRQQGLSNNPIGQGYNLALARHGISPGQDQEALLQMLGVADAYGLRGLMGGRPNQTLMSIAQDHLPQAGDSTQLAYDKLHTLSILVPQIKSAIEQAESTRLAGADPYGNKVQGAGAPQVGGIPPPPTANAGGAGQSKMVTMDLIHKYATEHKITDDAARDYFIQHGYAVVKPRGSK